MDVGSNAPKFTPVMH